MKKWLNWIALVVAFSIACGFLANWQFSRRETKLAAIELVKQNYSSNPVPVGSLLKDGSFELSKDTWRVVLLTGHYLPEKSLIVRNRPNNGQPGFEELLPFQSSNSEVFYVSRGWLPSGDKQDTPDEIPLPSLDETTIKAHLVAAEPTLERGAPVGQIASINPRLADSLTGVSTSATNGYFRLISETPSVGKSLTPMPAPVTEEGNNLSYALQWILFAIMATGALVWRIRRDRQLELGIEPKVRRRRSDVDAAYEDVATTKK